MLKRFLSLPILFLLHSNVLALPPLPNFYDNDQDGLVEIQTLNDLNRIPKSGDTNILLDGELGCPNQECIGFELLNDINFDTNGDGQLNANDELWNDGKGWQPARLESAVFEGNGHAIRNLFSDQDLAKPAGLFSVITDATVKNLAIVGPLTHIKGSEATGLIAGVSFNSQLSGIFLSGVSEGGLAGSVIGSVSENESGSTTTLRNIFSTSSVLISGGIGGGIFGHGGGTESEFILSLSSVERSDSPAATIELLFGGLSATGGDFTHAYWASDLSDQFGAGSNTSGGLPITLAELECNKAPCSREELFFADWPTDDTEEKSTYWDFSASGDLPSLVLNGIAYPRIDFTGSLFIDRDNDGVPDSFVEECTHHCPPISGLIFDQFPENPAFSVDEDMDGLADQWNPGCDEHCRADNQNLLDLNLADHDNDGLKDDEDTDDDNDGVPDADLDSDGLIEISSWDEFNAIRYDPNAKGLRFSESESHNSSGCPTGVVDHRRQANLCKGYELESDLNFDTNSDGQIDVEDEYWREGMGWPSIPHYTGHFNGNGFAIRNLQGESLFLSLEKANVYNLALTGPQLSTKTGVLAYSADTSIIHSIFVTGQVGVGLGGSYHPYNLHNELEVNNGGLISTARDSKFSNIFSSVYVEGHGSGGILGEGKNIVGVALLSTNSAGGGLIGPGSEESLSEAKFDQSYWVNRSTPFFPEPEGENFSAKLELLQCPTAADNNLCISTRPLYSAWESQINTGGLPIWDFGNEYQLPGLLLGGKVYRDSDGDGYLDEDDAFPNNFAFAIDADGDGAPDIMAPNCGFACQMENSEFHLDKFPNHSSASKDEDNDGFPEQWNALCDEACQQDSGLAIDTHPEDSDNDGIGNARDSDDNNDGVTDADANSNGLIEIYTLAQLDAVRYSLAGHGRRMSEKVPLDSSGCPDKYCVGYELMNDLDFDSNGDGIVNDHDEIWYNTSGWLALGAPTNEPFTGVFDGRGNALLNFTVLVGDQDFCGLFSTLQQANVRRLAIQGSVNCPVYGGFLAAKAYYSTIEGIALAGDFSLFNEPGGTLFGDAFYSTGVDILTSVITPSYPLNDGRLMANGTTNRVRNALISQTVLAPRDNEFGNYFRSYWALDQGVTSEAITTAAVEQLRCPTVQNSTSCAEGVTLYEQWDNLLGGLVKWDFGTALELPALEMGNKKYRDNNLDGRFDEINPSSSSSSSISSSSSDGSSSVSSTSSSSSEISESAGSFDLFLFLGLFGLVIGVKLRKRTEFV